MLGGLRAQRDSIEELWGTDFTEDRGKINAPTPVVQGDGEQIVPIETSGMRSSKLIRGAPLKVCPGAPHGLRPTRIPSTRIR
jgi:non-heme chloroperoxidase